MISCTLLLVSTLLFFDMVPIAYHKFLVQPTKVRHSILSRFVPHCCQLGSVGSCPHPSCFPRLLYCLKVEYLEEFHYWSGNHIGIFLTLPLSLWHPCNGPAFSARTLLFSYPHVWCVLVGYQDEGMGGDIYTLIAFPYCTMHNLLIHSCFKVW